jgi:hypothetical protein
MITGSIQNQQFEHTVRNEGLRKAAKSPEPPPLSNDETSMIKKNFTPGKTHKLYDVQGDVHKTNVELGQNIDTRV